VCRRGRADYSKSPDAGGSCIDVPTAVAGWKKHMEPLSNFNSAIYLGSPAVTNAAASDTTGLGWLAKFLEACDGCTIDFINIHWYVPPPSPSHFPHPHPHSYSQPPLGTTPSPTPPKTSKTTSPTRAKSPRASPSGSPNSAPKAPTTRSELFWTTSCLGWITRRIYIGTRISWRDRVKACWSTMRVMG